MNVNSNQQAFFALVKAGLWEQNGQLSSEGVIVFNDIYLIAEEQSVVGIVAAGLEHIVDVKAPKEILLTFAGEALQLEQRNEAMNGFVAILIEILRKNDIYALLIKGQGIAQCYERPLWRSAGDVDLLLSDDNYKRAIKVLTGIANSVDEEIKYHRHLTMTIEGWTVELHGSLRSGLWRRIDKVLDDVQDSLFYEGKVRSWMDGNTQVFLPKVDEDVVFVFSHILQHFFKEGIGLRQICDWCRLLWKYRDAIDVALLGSRLEKMGGNVRMESICCFSC